MTEEIEKLNIRLGVILSSVSRNAGGVFESVHQACKSIQSDVRFDIQVHGVRDDQTDQDLASWAPVEVNAHKRHGPAGFAYARGLKRALVRDDKIDILHQHGIWQSPSIATLNWHRATRRPVVISPHGMLDPWALKSARIKKQVAATVFENANLRSAACLHALNTDELIALRRFGLTNPVAIIANGVNLPPVVLEANIKIDDKGRKTLLFLGRLHPKKGLIELLKAWLKLKQLAPAVYSAWKIVIAGWGEEEYVEMLRRTAMSLGLEHDVSFPGPLFGDEKEAAFRRASAFVLVSYSEGLPMAILEAWAHELPVFMTRACNLQVGFDAGAAIEVQPEPNQLFESLKHHLVRNDLERIGGNGRRLASEQFSWASIGSDFRKLYSWILSGTPISRMPSFVRV